MSQVISSETLYNQPLFDNLNYTNKIDIARRKYKKHMTFIYFGGNSRL